jgi:predicted adenylyl cyclase CyaB
MPRNVEIKARVTDLDALRRRAESMSDALVEVLDQRDTFFVVPRGRLKLRVLAPDACELIYYERPDSAGAKLSEYTIVRSADPETFLKILCAALPIRGVVAKRRFLYRIGRTRLHLDDVEGLGTFMELEVVLDEGESSEQGHAIAERLLEDLGVAEADRVSGAYIDLLEVNGR